MISTSRWSGGECGEPLKQHSENGGKQIRPVLEDLLGAGRQFCLRPHWQREQGEPWIEISLLAELLKAQPDHPIHKRLQLLRHHHDHSQMQHLGVELQKTKALSAEAVFKPRLGVHLHLKQHHWVLRGAGLAAFGPKGPIKTMVSCFELRRVKSIERITRRIRPERGKRRRTLRQQQGDQIRRALEQPVEPVIGFQSPSLRTEQPSDTGQPSASRSHHSTPVLLRGVSTVPRACDQAPAVGMLLRPRPPPAGTATPRALTLPRNPQPTTHNRSPAARAAAASATARASKS